MLGPQCVAARCLLQATRLEGFLVLVSPAIQGHVVSCWCPLEHRVLIHATHRLYIILTVLNLTFSLCLLLLLTVLLMLIEKLTTNHILAVNALNLQFVVN